MKKKIIIVLIFTMILLPYKVNAECSSEKINELKKIADNITAVSQFDEENAKIGNYGYNIVTVYGLIDGFYATNRNQNEFFSYSESDSGAVTETVDYNFGNLIIFADACPNQVLKSIDLDLKKMNLYYNEADCEDLKDEIDVCSKFYDTDNLSYNKFLEIVNEYKKKKDNLENEKFNLVTFLKNNLIMVIIGSIVILSIIIFVIISNIKKNRLD